VIQLPSAQKVSFMEHGTRGGIIVFYFGASNFNHKACPDSTGVLRRLNVRLIIIDRPGYGQSTLRKGFNDSPLLFARNAFGHILSHFGCTSSEGAKAKKPFFIGYQTGCIYLLSIAHLFPSAVEDMALICPPTPHRDGPTSDMLSRSDFAMRWCTVHCLRCVFCCHYRPTVRGHFMSSENYLEFCRVQSPRALAKDPRFLQFMEQYEGSDDRVWTEWFVFLSQRWGIPLHSLSTHFHLWYGTEDAMSPYSSWFEGVLSNVTVHRVHGYGHLLILPKFDEIISSMIHCDL